MTQSPSKLGRSAIAVTVLSLVFFAACGTKQKSASPLPTVSGAKSGVFANTMIINHGPIAEQHRTAALLGIFISEYLSVAPTAMAADSALQGVNVSTMIATSQSTVTDPDFDLLQAFADALQVDVADLLNRSTDRQQTLDTYTEALTNIATRANDRYKELVASDTELKNQLHDQNKQKSDADRALSTALRNKDFSGAAEKQKAVNDLQAKYSATDLQRKQVEDLIDTLDALLTLYGQKILAIQSNREALIAGTKVVDVPGADDLKVIERMKVTSSHYNNKGTQYDPLFQSQ